MKTKQITSRNQAQTNMGVNYSALVIAIFLILLIPSVLSVPTSKTNVNTLNGIQIFNPEFDSVKQNEGFLLHVHISNISNGLPLPNTFADCFLHLYDINGSHTYENGLNKDSNGVDYEMYLNKGNFTNLGQHSYYIWCNNTAAELGGATKGEFLVTPTGFSGNNNLVFSLFIILFIFGITLLGLYTRNEVMTMIGGMGLLILSIYIHQSGIIIFRNTLTTFIGYLTLALGVVATFTAAYELWENNR